MLTKLDIEEIEDLAAGISADELREFLEADQVEVPFDPEFKERLRARLWELVRARFGEKDSGEA